MPQFFFCLILLVCTLPTYSQDYEKKIDSLNARIPFSTGVALTSEFNKISEYSLLIDKDTAFVKINSSLETARKSKEPYAKFLALRNLSHLHAHYLQQTEALRYMQEGLTYAREQTDSFTLALSHFYTAEFYKQQQLLPTALENLLKASSLFEALDDHRYVAECRNMAANIHYGARNFIQAIEGAQQAISHYKPIPESDQTSEDEFQAMSTYNTLSLYLAKKTFDKLKGTIQISNEFEKGSTFTVTLPYTPH